MYLQRKEKEEAMSAATADRLFEVSDAEELFKELSKRKHWNLIRPETLRLIFRNAESDILRIRTFLEWNSIKRIQRFVVISEESRALEERFIQFGKDSDAKEATSNFAAVLNSFASSLGDQLTSFPSESEQQQTASVFTEMAFQSAILCNPFQLPSYFGLAYYYVQTGQRDVAREVCKEFYGMIQILDGTEENELSYANRVIKKNQDGLLSKMKQDMEQMKKEYDLG